LIFAVFERWLIQHWIDCKQFFLYNIFIDIRLLPVWDTCCAIAPKKDSAQLTMSIRIAIVTEIQQFSSKN